RKKLYSDPNYLTPIIMINGEKRFPDRRWMQTALLIAAMVPVTTLALYLEQRTFNGINLWIKPLKFQTSTAIHLLTLYLVATLMTDVARRKKLLIGLVWLSAIASLFEIFIITLRASQATASHYNFSTPMDSLIYALMGIGAVSMLLPACYLGVRFFRNKDGFKGGTGLHFGIAIGFVGAFVLTLLFAGYMSSSGSHWTSGQGTDAGGLLLTGWSQTGGDLRPAHFFALHMMQVLPIAGLFGDTLFKGDTQKAKWPVWITLLLMAGLSIFTFMQALNGKAFMVLG
ncbi:MAG: hypothetical protein KJP04_08840, partial [Arenicella sp.]|nr:hypothetical protein [Arenicella sp.]